jgi:predicted DNA-binding ribbon-helix-helix protein
MMSSVVKRSVLLGDHKTSVSLEQPFWDSMKKISRERGKTVSELVNEIDDNRQGNLSSAIRLFVLDYFRTTAECNSSKAVDAKAGCLTVATTPGPSPGVAGSSPGSNVLTGKVDQRVSRPGPH